MLSKTEFPSLNGWEATRDTLKWYSRTVGAIPRAHAEPHPKWWHISLKVESDGLVTERVALPDMGELELKIDLRRHVVVMTTSPGEQREFSLAAGLSATEFGNQLLDTVGELGLKGEYAREKFENDESRQYDPGAAARYLTAIYHADRLLKQHRSRLGGERGPVQLWPHGFDLAFEWFGTRQVTYAEGGEINSYPSQINFGFSPGEPHHPAPYFNANPWPFEQNLLVGHALPSGARWFQQGWQGTLLPYAQLVDAPDAAEKLLGYFEAVYAISAPLLME